MVHFELLLDLAPSLSLHHMKFRNHHVPQVEGVREQDSISVWRMPTALSQSRLGGRSSPSNACTVIAVRMAEVIHRTNTRMPVPVYKSESRHEKHRANEIPSETKRAAAGQEDTSVCKDPKAITNALCPPNVISCLTNSIVDGNIIHEAAVRSRGNGEQNFTIPDAIRACKNAVKEIDFCSVPGPLNTELPFYIWAVIRSPALSRDLRLFLLLIAFERTVLVVFERAASSLTLFDSHMHGHSEGAVIATAHIDNVEDLCHWLSYNIFHESQSQRDRNREFEISLIRFCGETSSSDCCVPTSIIPCEIPVFATAKRRRKRRLDTKTNAKMAKVARLECSQQQDREAPRLSYSSRLQSTVPLSSLENLRSRV
ncbi:unnamed protein product [Cylicocyclus nassatus]|uniref:Uncharacterized protein n=1 Tax=Cylicocyclus nassatus TaxID=53992 RepID=A0AA36H1A8_CYLNA|nr:unnamed protein product [Cylicocyclus nassatus]